MKKTKPDKNSFTYKFKRKCRKLCVISALIAAAGAAVYRVITHIRSNSMDKKNIDNPIRRYIAFLDKKDIVPESGVIDGITISSCLSVINVDLSNCEFKDDAFISLKCCVSSVRIKVPAGINVKFDGLIDKSTVDNNASDDSLTKTVYVASKIHGSAIRIKNN